MQNAYDTLQKVFGFNEFRHHQADIIESLLNNQDAMVLMPTGGGKSLCYQIPSIVRDGVGIIVSPLIALMQDQVDALTQNGVAAAFINSSQDSQTQHQVEQQLLNNSLDMLYITPERLLLGRTQALLRQCQIALFAIDEAHCVSQWGHDFRPEYQQLKILHQQFPNVPRVALTATADKRTRREIIEQLDLHTAKTYINSFDRPNIHYRINEQQTKEHLWDFLENNHKKNAGIIYCLSRKKVEDTAQWLVDQGRDALPYHAGLSQQVREQNQRRFIREEGIIIVATIAFGMGIDKPDVRFVAHLNLPKSIEAYYQETGRAGRDGLPADAWMTYSLKDLMTLRQMNQDPQNPFQERVNQSKLDTLMALCETIQCRRQHLLRYFDEASDKACGNCDICIDPPKTWDATEAARKALSCVYRTEQRFGVGYVVDVLCGKDDDRIKRNGHEGISTFGIGSDITAKEWKNIFRQLIGAGFLDINSEAYGALFLTEKARPILKGEQSLELRLTKKSKAAKTGSASRSVIRDVDEELFEALRQCRYQLAQKESVPPYVIFHDKTLIEMTRKRPDDLSQMALIAGIGDKKLDKFGQYFLDIIKQHHIHPWFKNDLSETINETLTHYLKQKNVEDVANIRQLTPSTVYNHLAKAIEQQVIQISDIYEITNDDIDAVTKAIELCEIEGENTAKAVFTALNQEIEYGIINCVRAGQLQMDNN